MELPRTPSPPPPPPSPPEVLEPMDLSSERPEYHPMSGHSPNHHSNGRHMEMSRETLQEPRQNQVGTTILRGIPIVSLYIDSQERLCLAQISNTLLKNFSYNEIHNRRVALGITCVQCTPVQLEILRRAGAMPISSRRCGMITKREAERLVKSFLEEHAPPKLPDSFAFKVRHTCGWGCKGSFMPSRYNSSRAKCIKCTYCNLYFSPNKFIFHFHRAPDAKYRHPDAANFNSWRRHLDLDYEPLTDDLMHAWEDVKAMFNGGSRKRLVPCRSATKMDEKRHRLSVGGGPSIPKMSTHPNFPMFPANNSVPNMFPQQSPYNQLSVMGSDMDNLGDGRRVCFPDLWRPKNSMSYYNPLSLMWAKNFGLCPPGAQPAGTKQDNLRDSVLRMPGMFMDMNGNKAAVESSARSKTEQTKNRSSSRSSAFRPVGNFGHCPTLSPTSGAEFNMPVFPAPSMSTLSEKSDDFSETMANDEDIDVDVDVEDAMDSESDNGQESLEDFALAADLGPEMTMGIDERVTEQQNLLQDQQQQQQQPDNKASTKPTQSHLEQPMGVQRRDHVTSFSIDSLFDTKKYGAQNTMTTSEPSCTVATPSDNNLKLDLEATKHEEDQEQTKSLGYILNLSKEELQSELLKLMESRGNVDQGRMRNSHDV